MSGFVIWILQWVALAGWLFANLGLAPLFLGLGVHYNSTGLINAGVWAEGHQGVVITSIIGAAAHGDPAGDGLQELRPPAVLHVRRHRHPRASSCWRSSCARSPAAVRRGDQPLQRDRRQEPDLLHVAAARRERQPASTSSPSSRWAPRCWPRRSPGPARSGPPTAWSRAARSRAPASSRTRCSSSSAR